MFAYAHAAFIKEKQMTEETVYTCKFGGSSLADGARVAKVAELIRSDPRRRYVVVSAPGRKDPGDHKVTDLLYAAYENKRLGLEFREAYDRAERPLEHIAKHLDWVAGGKGNIDVAFDKILLDNEKIVHEQDVSADFVASRGEYLMARLLAMYLDWPFVDAKDIVRFTSQGKFDAELTQQIASAELKKYPRAVIPGFYGVRPEGDIKTFSRGGSDLTGAIVARATISTVYENWTDVPGLMSADPRIVPEARAIEAVTYRELRELSYMGASVFHEEAVIPAKIAGTTIHIRNTHDPEGKGTRVMHESHRGHHPVVVGIAGLKGFSTIQVRKTLMNEEIGFARRLLTVLADEGISVEHMPGGIDALSVIVPTPMIYDREVEIETEIENICRVDDVQIDHGLALIATVGHGMWHTPGVAARLTGALAKASINIQMINQGSSELNIIVGVAEGDYEEAIRAIHREFFP
ncbi:aspartate kinase [Candidatus Uhrbacteria bacterium]|nr:aspartate kinase [Candidatus Uhrbacteria bacterium]